jgi:hypothetical protein
MLTQGTETEELLTIARLNLNQQTDISLIVWGVYLRLPTTQSLFEAFGHQQADGEIDTIGGPCQRLEQPAAGVGRVCTRFAPRNA